MEVVSDPTYGLDDHALARAHKAIMVGRTEGVEVPLLVAGQGAVAWDIAGREYIDCTAQAWTLNVGYNHPKVLAAAIQQMQLLTHVRATFDTPPYLRLSARLSEIAPMAPASVTYALHASVAVEGAIKLALHNTSGRKNFVTLFDGFHGRTLATMAMSWPTTDGTLLPFTGNVVRVPQAYCYRCPLGLGYPGCDIACVDLTERMVRQAVDGKPVAFVMEPVQGSGGQIEFPLEYYRRIRELCDRHGMLLVWDEVQTAFGRVGTMFAAELYGVVPDILVFGKAVGGGFPLAGTLSRSDLKPLGAGEHMFTFAQFPVSMAAALATMEVLQDESLLERCQIVGNHIRTRLGEMQQKYRLIGDVRGPGLMIGVELVRDRKSKEPAFEETVQFLSEGLRRGVIFGMSKRPGLGNVVKIKPPLVITDEQVERVLTVFEAIVNDLEGRTGGLR